MRGQFNSRRTALGVSLAALTVAVAAPGAASAQRAPTGDTEVESVVVTASRIVRDGFEAPTPTTVVGTADIERQAVSNVANYLNQLPALGSAAGNSPRTTNFQPGNNGGTNSFNARNLGTARTLTLLDGRRVAGANLTGIVDINTLPSNLVRRVDVVTGGASAAWGSDAVGGVVNFVLDKNFTGLKGSASIGQSWLGDGDSKTAEMAFGTRFAGGRGHFLFSAQMQSDDGIFRNDSRDWYIGYKAVPNINRTAANGQPGFIGMANAGMRLATTGGAIVSGPLAGVQFGPGGAVLPYRLSTAGSGLIGAGGDVQDVGGLYPVLAQIDNQNLFARVSYDVTDDINAYIEVGQGWSYGLNYTSHYGRHNDLRIFADNAFLPAALNLQGQTSFLIGRMQNDPGLGPVKVDNKRDLRRVVVGLDGKTDWFNGSFRWNAYYQHGETKQFTQSSRNTIIANFNRAVDAIRNPAVGGVAGVPVGAPICRSTLTDPTNGCVAFNVFGEGSPSLAAVDYVAGEAWQENLIQQDVGSVGFQVEPLSLPAGPVSIAAGVEARREMFKSHVDDLDARPDLFGPAPYWFGNYKISRGRYLVKEGFIEVIAPLLKDVPFFQTLDFNGAARSTDYSTSGRVTTWKYGATWDVNDQLRFRGTKSRDIRAPNLNDLFLGATGTGIGVLVPGTNAQQFVTQLNGGNPNLTPEIADTTAYGVVFRPSFLPGFSASIDRYEISIADAIVSLTSQQVVNLCYGVGVPQNTAACNNITLNPNPANPGLAGQIAGAIVRVGGANIAKQVVAGYDIEIGYRTDLSALRDGWVGAIDLRAIGNNLTEWSQTVAGVTSNFKGMVNGGVLPAAGGPEWRWLITANYVLGPSATTLTIRHIGESVINNEPRNSSLAVLQNRVRDVQYLDISQSWNLEVLGADAQIFGKIENVFDQDPPLWASTAGSAYAASGTDFAYFDEVGRFWRLGVRFRY